MKNLFLDTNIIIDFLANRRPFSDDAAKLLSLAMAGEARLFISAVSYNNIYYILRQFNSNSEVLKLLNQLSGYADIVDVTQAVIKKSLKTSLFADFEDAIQYYSALSIRALTCIVTRNTRDFRKSEVPVMSSKEALQLFM